MDANTTYTDLRNVAIIAHVDHGKTTLVDFLLKQSQTFRENEAEMQQTTILDSNPLERERGITILAKNTAVVYKQTKINIIDTPGHADFSGEVERTLNMADGVLLIIDAQEGPMPQTKFVLQKALELKLHVIVVINKIDKPLANIDQTIEKTNNLFLELATDSEQLNFPVVYAIGREGKAGTTPEEAMQATNLETVFETILSHIPAPKIENGPFRMLVTSLDYDTHKGKHVIGRIERGVAEKGKPVLLLKKDNQQENGRIETLMITYGLKKQEVEKVTGGDIIDVTGISGAEIGDTIADPSDPTPLARIAVEEPTMKIAINANSSPLAGKEGKFSNSRQLSDRLDKELETNISLQLTREQDGFIVAGKGELHLAVLIETLRREGYEFEVGKPQVVTKMVDGVLMEPVETVYIEVPDEFLGAVTGEMGRRKGAMVNMFADGKGNTSLEYTIASKALLGIRNMLLTKTKGSMLLNTTFHSFQPMTPPLEKLRNGVLIASESGVALTYGLNNAQERGITFIDPGTQVYEGMIIGLNSRNDDIEINVTKEKKQTNMRASSADMPTILTPATKMSLEQFLDFIEDDELLEVTPLSLRPRKRYLSKVERVRNQRSN